MNTIKRSKVRTRGLKDVVWEAPTVAATLFIGRNKGKEARNRKGFCAREPKQYTQKALDTHVQGAGDQRRRQPAQHGERRMIPCVGKGVGPGITGYLVTFDAPPRDIMHPHQPGKIEKTVTAFHFIEEELEPIASGE